MPKPPASPRTLAAKVRPFSNTAQQEAVTTYSAALHAMQCGNYDGAMEKFLSLDENCAPELRERARVYLQACERELRKRTAQLEFHSPSEQFDYAIGCINNGDFEEARYQLEAIVEREDTIDYAHYGLAILHGITGQAEGCLHHLERAILLNPYNRIHARSDTDFRPMADDPRFTELLYPEAM